MHLSTKDLLRASLVSKFWNYEARYVLRDEEKCVAVINGDRPCINAQQLDATLGSLNVKFFNGLSIFIDKQHSASSSMRGRVEDVYGNLIKMPRKYLEFKWSTKIVDDCLLGQFILRLMSRSFTVEQLI